jgi:predicted patatin/cPLA2 family phospholipase
MTAQKHTGQAPARSSTATTAVTTSSQASRKPWKKKTPVEVVLDQINRLRDDVVAKEEELKQAKRQLQKLEEAKKVLEAT